MKLIIKFAIDVPEPYHLTKNYWASLGHKANHNFEPNAQYIQLFHPKFGDIMWVSAIKDILKGEEIFVDYGYNGHCRGPEWFRGLKRKYKQLRKNQN